MDGADYLTDYNSGKKEFFAQCIQSIFSVFHKFSGIDRSIFNTNSARLVWEGFEFNQKSP